jgi:hypothetical protein
MTVSDAEAAASPGSEYHETGKRQLVPVPETVRAGAKTTLAELSSRRAEILDGMPGSVAYWLGRLEGTVMSFLISTEPLP